MAAKRINRDIVFTLILLALCVVLMFVQVGYQQPPKQYASETVKARVLEVDNSEVLQTGLVRNGTQTLTVKVLAGTYKDQTIEVYNHLTGKMELDEVYIAGRTILVEIDADEDGQAGLAYARGSYRIGRELFLVGLFALLLLVVAGWTGLKAIVSFIFAALMIWRVMIPCILDGMNPIWIALAVVAALTAVISFLVGGINRKGLVTFLGAFLGLVTTCVLAILFAKGFYLHGAVKPFAETLLYSGFYDLDLTKIFLAGIFVASSGAVMDLAMDISAAMDEIKKKKPDITHFEHFCSGMAVGRSVVGTMTTTLLMAYSSSYMAMLMLFMGQGIPIITIFNMNFVSAEVLNVLVGSFGLVTVAPFTALVGSFLYRAPFKSA